jgi:hypothetical protein
MKPMNLILKFHAISQYLTTTLPLEEVRTIDSTEPSLYFTNVTIVYTEKVDFPNIGAVAEFIDNIVLVCFSSVIGSLPTKFGIYSMTFALPSTTAVAIKICVTE